MQETILDLEHLRHVSGGDEGFEDELLSEFCEVTSESLASLVSAIESGRASEVMSRAHLIKGSARTIGAVVIGEIASAIESSARLGDLSVAHESFPRLTAAFNEFERITSDRRARNVA
jgi:HPt (histidine-containing phosphotransfer) domain-containing protein